MRPSWSRAEQMVIWGSGTPRREFLQVDDCADALVHMMRNYSAAQHLNVGIGRRHRHRRPGPDDP